MLFVKGAHSSKCGNVTEGCNKPNTSTAANAKKHFPQYTTSVLGCAGVLYELSDRELGAVGTEAHKNSFMKTVKQKCLER